MNELEQAVLDAYATIGRTGSEIDEAGFDYWVNQLESGALTQDDLYNAFSTAVEQDMARDPTYAASINEFNTSLEGQNFDTSDITAAYRELFGRNPEQEGYQYWASVAQSDPTFNSDALRAALLAGAQGSDATAAGGFTSADVAALEADPYAGRYATRSIYDLIDDAVNVSSIGDRQVQFVTPIGQMPGISAYNQNGEYSFNEGDYTLNPQQAYAQIGMALDSGAITADQYLQMMNDLGKATTIDGVRSVFNAPTATVNLGNNGFQTGVNGQDIDFGPLIANNYAGVDTGTTKAHVLTDKTLATKMPGIVNTITNQLQKVNPKFDTINTGEIKDLGTFGATRGDTMDAGPANYQSSLIESLRDATGQRENYNTGFNMWGVEAPTLVAKGPAGSQTPTTPSAFNPEIQTTTPATEQEIADSNAYNAYRIGAIKDPNTEVLSFEDWLAQQETENTKGGGGSLEPIVELFTSV